MNVIRNRALDHRLFFYIIGILCLTYGVFEYLLIPYSTLAADEFVFARHIQDYTQHLPYVSFSPYKSTLGHYVLSIPLFFSHDALFSMFYIKYEIALLNIAFIILACYASTPLFRRRAIALSMFAILANQLFIVYSTELRVDMLASWACLFSVLALLRARPKLAGSLMGIAFLISQKAIWYLASTNIALLLTMLLLQRADHYKRTIFLFNAYAALVLCTYLGVWSCIAGPTVVFTNFFYDAFVQVGVNLYAIVYPLFWRNVLLFSPFLFFLWPLVSLCLLTKASHPKRLEQQLFITIFTAASLLLFISYKQAFPYNFVFTVPAFYVLYAAFFTWAYTEDRPTVRLQLSLPFLAACVALYAVPLALQLHYLALPLAYSAITLLPLALAVVIASSQQPRLKAWGIGIVQAMFVVLVILLPYHKAIYATGQLRGEYQQANIRVGEALLKEGSGYMAGVPLIYTVDQPITGMKNLIVAQLDYLDKPSADIKPMLLDSLYLAPVSQASVLHALATHPVTFYYDDYRMQQLPPAVKQFLNNNYAHYYGSIYLYAPKMASGMQSITLPIAGRYRVEAPAGAFVNMDGHIVAAGQMVRLATGQHVSSSLQPFRLVLVPALDLSKYSAGYQQDDWVSMLKMLLW